MKKIIYITLAAFGLSLFASCGSSSSGDDVPALYGQLAGDWHLTTWNGETPQDFDAYVSFTADRSFVIYQKIESVKYQKFTGSYRVDGDVLSGVYNDNVAWGSQYVITLDEAAAKLTMTSKTAVEEVSVYIRATIPDQVKGEAKSVTSSRTDVKRLL